MHDDPSLTDTGQHRSSVVHGSEQDRLTKDLTRFLFPRADMAQAGGATDALRLEHQNGDLRRALETAIAVCYGRPYLRDNEVGSLGDEWAPQDAGGRAIHVVPLALRDQVYAHNDLTPHRSIIDAGAVLGDPLHVEEWKPINRDALPGICSLCEHQRSHFEAMARDSTPRGARRPEDALRLGLVPATSR